MAREQWGNGEGTARERWGNLHPLLLPHAPVLLAVQERLHELQLCIKEGKRLQPGKPFRTARTSARTRWISRWFKIWVFGLFGLRFWTLTFEPRNVPFALWLSAFCLFLSWFSRNATDHRDAGPPGPDTEPRLTSARFGPTRWTRVLMGWRFWSDQDSGSDPVWVLQQFGSDGFLEECCEGRPGGSRPGGSRFWSFLGLNHLVY